MFKFLLDLFLVSLSFSNWPSEIFLEKRNEPIVKGTHWKRVRMRDYMYKRRKPVTIRRNAV